MAGAGAGAGELAQTEHLDQCTRGPLEVEYQLKSTATVLAFFGIEL